MQKKTKTKKSLRMQKHFNALCQKIELVRMMPAPQNDQVDGDTVIDILPNDLMRMYVAIAQFLEKLQQRHDRMHPNGKQGPILQPESMSLIQRAEYRRYVLGLRRYKTFMVIFQQEMEEEMGKRHPDIVGKLASKKYSINLRKNWSVVLSPKAKPEIWNILGF